MNTFPMNPFLLPKYLPITLQICLSILLHPIRIIRGILTDPKDIIAPAIRTHSRFKMLGDGELCQVPYKHFPQSSFILPVFPFFGVGELHIHVAVQGIQSAVVFHAPFELYDDVFSSQILKKGFWIDLPTSEPVN